MTSVILSFPDRTQGEGPVVGGFMLIEGDDETDSELCLITDFDVTGYTFMRGVLDTTPRAWAAGTSVWFFDQGMVFADYQIRSDAETVGYRILIRTSMGLLAVGLAPLANETLTVRPHYPLRPANVMADGDFGFAAGTLDMTLVIRFRSPGRGATG